MPRPLRFGAVMEPGAGDSSYNFIKFIPFAPHNTASDRLRIGVKLRLFYLNKVGDLVYLTARLRVVGLHGCVADFANQEFAVAI